MGMDRTLPPRGNLHTLHEKMGIRVLCANNLPPPDSNNFRPLEHAKGFVGFPSTPNHSALVVDPYVTVEFIAPCDEKVVFTTDVVHDNGYNPSWCGPRWATVVTEPDLTFLHVQVLDMDTGRMLGYNVLPCHLLRSGVRSVELLDKEGMPARDRMHIHSGLLLEILREPLHRPQADSLDFGRPSRSFHSLESYDQPLSRNPTRSTYDQVLSRDPTRELTFRERRSEHDEEGVAGARTVSVWSTS